MSDLRSRLTAACLLTLSLVSCEPSLEGPALLVDGLEIPYALEVIGARDFLFAERRGSLSHYDEGEVNEVLGLPEVSVMEHDGLVLGGLMDVSLHPEFATNSLVYIAYVNAEGRLSLARFELREDRAEALEVLHAFDEFTPGSRIAWQDAEHLFVSMGAGGSPYPDPGPQDLSVDIGKIHRLTAEGEVPADNPVFEGASGPSTIWSYGHRNPQGLYYEQSSDTLYATEHGPKGGDELNLIRAGGNYGWPLFSYGLNYDDTPVSALSEEEAATFSILPLAHWTPDFRVAPSGLLRLEGSSWAQLEGSFVFGALNPEHLLRYDVDTQETSIMLADVGRVRDVAQLPDGELLISIDASGPGPDDSGRIFVFSPDDFDTDG